LSEDSAVSHEQIRRIAERALVIERYILERAWGSCYAVIWQGIISLNRKK
jgi:hypothetical protein